MNIKQKIDYNRYVKIMAEQLEQKGLVHRNIEAIDDVNLLLQFKDEQTGKNLFSPKIITSLRSSGYDTLTKIVSIPDVKVLTDVGGIGEKTADVIWEEVTKYFGVNSQTALTYEERLEKYQVRCSTGAKALDSLLGGGIPTKQITEFYGEPQMGKTQLCYNIAVNSLIHKNLGGYYELDKIETNQRPRVYWVDTEFTFDPVRIRKLVSSRFPELNASEILDNIIIVQPVSSDELIREVEKIFQSPDNVVTVIIDSLMAPFRSEALLSFAQLNPRQQKLQQVLGIIKRGMKVRNLAVILTNQVTTKISLSGPMGGPPQMTAAGGLAVAHTVTNRIRLKKATKAETKSRNDIEVRKAIVEDSPFLKDGSALFVLSEIGIIDFTTALEKEVDKPLSGDSDIFDNDEIGEENAEFETEKSEEFEEKEVKKPTKRKKTPKKKSEKVIDSDATDITTEPNMELWEEE
jgi:DNA repair protein RadA